MSLIKNHVLSEAALDARRRNGQQSRGAVTTQGRERTRAASLKHGIYSKERDQALRSLGEDPAELDELIAGSYEQWRPDNDQQTGLVEQLAHLQWRMARAARMQERLAARHVKRSEADQREQNDAALDRWAEMEESLELVAQHALRPDFYASPAYLSRYPDAFDYQLFEPSPMISVLLHSLRLPKNLPPASAPLPDGALNDADWHAYLAWLEEQSLGARDEDEGEYGDLGEGGEESNGLDEGEETGDDSEDDVPYPDIPVGRGGRARRPAPTTDGHGARGSPAPARGARQIPQCTAVSGSARPRGSSSE